MASDYGDDSGEKMLDGFTRMGERMGIDAMYRRSNRLQDALENARAQTSAYKCAEDGGETRVEWAKLDMAEFRDAEDYDEIKQAVEERIRACGIEPAWFEDAEHGKEYLLFRISDAHDVWACFDDLSDEVGSAAEKAAGKLKDIRDSRPLEERAREAREASAALEADRASGKAQAREPRFQELRSR